MLSDWAPLAGILPIEVGTTVFAETKYTFPASNFDENLYEEYLCIKVEGYEGLLSINGKPYHGTDANHERIQVPRNLSGRTVRIQLELYSPKRHGISGVKPLCINKSECIEHFTVNRDNIQAGRENIF